eukprot:TRINITY_DN32159_c0_g1_i2.p1 TRINITY_DN32159_c0_g1~~TRINITY_DN32159_c0_g1_i2.p1  ORF type:complete len:492 (+),score=63.25 TRINITY_DN32159_c0_g1_i2:27-1502(+)
MRRELLKSLVVRKLALEVSFWASLLMLRMGTAEQPIADRRVAEQMNVDEHTSFAAADKSNATRQVAIVGMLAFCGPGLFNALNGLGRAGSSNARVAAVANGCLYCTFAMTSYFSGAAFSVFGPFPLLSFGGLTYAVYAMSVYFSSTWEWLPILGGTLLGIGAGLFWTAQGSLMMAYATPSSKGRLIGMFWVIFNLGGVLGGLLEFRLNHDNEQSGANPTSYFALITIMLIGALAAPFVLAHPSTVVKEDGTVVIFQEADSPKEELLAALKATSDPFIRYCLPFFLASNWFYTYDFNGFNGQQFNMRTRGLNSAFFWGAQMLAAVLFGRLLDANQPVSRRAGGAWIVVVSSLLVSFIAALVTSTMVSCREGSYGWDKGRPCELDYSEDFPWVLSPMFIFVLLGAADAIYQNFAYWLMSMAAGDNVRKTVMYAAVYKGVQSFGAGISWLVDLSDPFTYSLQGLVAMIFTIGACMPLLFAFQFIENSSEKRSQV